VESNLVLDQCVRCGDIDVEFMASRMLEKLDKYYYPINGILDIVIVLDPQYKPKILQFYFPQI